jgi:GNAT superfamily N-acetyltransferase
MTQIAMRPARREDLPKIVRMLADDTFGRDRERVAEPLAPGYLEAFDQIETDPRNLLVVAHDEDGGLHGCLQITFIPGLSNQGARLALISGVRVTSALRGQGLGGQMVEWAIEEARHRGCASVELLTHRSRADAQRFYGRLGFKSSHVGMKLALD